MKLDDALKGITLIALDTAPLIYFVERHLEYAERMRSIIRRIDSGQIMSFSSVITLTEVLTLPKRVGNRSLEREYSELLLNSRNFSLVDVNPEIAENAAEVVLVIIFARPMPCKLLQQSLLDARLLSLMIPFSSG